jgi:hypothetical protein
MKLRLTRSRLCKSKDDKIRYGKEKTDEDGKIRNRMENYDEKIEKEKRKDNKMIICLMPFT